MDKNSHLFLVDGSGYIFRAFHALPPLTRKSDGLPVGAVAGFCNMLWKLVRDSRETSVGDAPTHFAVIFDYSSATFRKEIYPEYKANRSAPPEELIPQFGLIRQATQAFNLPCIEKEGFEADDIIATYAKQASDVGARVTIVSSDKDLMQLVNDHVGLYDGMKDRHIDVSAVIEKWGVGPEKMVDLQALMGDSTDNVPGIPGIGPKTAAQLIEQFGNLDNLLAKADEIPQKKRRENIIEFADQARLSRELVKLCDTVPLDIDLDGLFLEAENGPKLIAFLKALEINTLTRRVAEATNCDASAISPATLDIEWGNKAHGPDLDVDETEGKNAGQGDLFGEPIAKTPVETIINANGDPIFSFAQLAEEKRLEAASSKIIYEDYTTIRDEAILKQWLDQAIDQGFMAFDTETTALDPMVAELVGFSIALAPNKSAYVPLNHISGKKDLLSSGVVENQLDQNIALALLKPVLEDSSVLKIAQNMKYDWLVMHQHGIDITAFDDTMLLSYVLDSGAFSHGMDALSERWLGHKPISYKDVTGSGKSSISFAEVDIEKASQYAAEDSDITLRLWQVLKTQVDANALARVYQRLEQPLVTVLAKMEERGILVDRQILSRLSGEFAQKAAGIEDEIYKLAGEKFNIGSPKQLGDILFDKMGLPGGAKTKTGQWSTSVQVLDELALSGHELPSKIVEWRQLSKLQSTYTDALPNFINKKTGRVHTNYAMAATSTGRLSSSEPNLQNIPVRTKEGRQIRTAFIAGEGNVLLSADYSQIELRVLAHVADIPQLKKAFANGLDIHAMTASEMFGVPIDGMPSETRRRAKAINFGIIYGISAFGLANQLGISREEASQYIKTYFERFPGIRDYMEDTKEFARNHGYVEDIFGRRAHFPEIKSSKAQIRAFNERAAINAPIQGAAADIIRRAMIRMDDALLNNNLSAKMLLQVHDELIFELPIDESDKTIKVVKDIMENAAMPAVNLSVPLQVDARTAKNWDEAH
ncbi:DNA polymerase I [Bartonella sp. HY329]|uniref:DNA polymerase I n=1 Tax=unclassified Bartonella TaxID=2645622 RepID=UPI0021C75612|nr:MULTISPECIES: DNA polymerase I [unclassified Bartonella]UXM95265.1 DNA polymerase I [Bartonella sp. HY329]UXN09589.1 DNA polymerase I [Bartonella sp. HY328]